ncbi:hypothetical protein MMC22_008280 [Lobaria immixta]|nr:hypothetical protein [Lobaria immixta]
MNEAHNSCQVVSDQNGEDRIRLARMFGQGWFLKPAAIESEGLKEVGENAVRKGDIMVEPKLNNTGEGQEWERIHLEQERKSKKAKSYSSNSTITDNSSRSNTKPTSFNATSSAKSQSKGQRATRKTYEDKSDRDESEGERWMAIDEVDVNIFEEKVYNAEDAEFKTSAWILDSKALLLPPVFERGGTYLLRGSRVISKADASAIEITAIAATIAPDEPIPGEHHFVTSDDTILGKSTTAPLDKIIPENSLFSFFNKTHASYQQGLGTFGHILKMPDPITQKLCLVRQKGAAIVARPNPRSTPAE